MEQASNFEGEKSAAGPRMAGWLTDKLKAARERLPAALRNPKLYLAALGMAASLGDMQAQSSYYSQPFVDLPVNEHFLDGAFNADDVVGAIFAPVAYEMNLGGGDDLHQFVVDFVYGGKDFDITQVEDSTQVEAMQDELTESLREIFKKEFLSLYGPFLREHMAEGFLDDWERTDMGMEFLGTISSMKITGSASPEAEKYGSKALRGESVQNENIELAKKRADFVKAALSRLFEEVGVSEFLIDIEVIGEEEQFSSQEMVDLSQVATDLGFGSIDTLEGVHALLMLYNNPDNRGSFSSDQLETMREIVDSKRTVEIDIVREGGDTKKILVPLPVLLLLFGLTMRRVLRKKTEEESESGDFEVEEKKKEILEKRKEQPISIEVESAPADTRVFSNVVEDFKETETTEGTTAEEANLPEQLPSAFLLEQGNFARVFTHSELTERIDNREAIERGLDYRSELSLAAEQCQTYTLRPELNAIEPELRKELEKIMPSVEEWQYAVKNLQNEKRFAEGAAGIGMTQTKKGQFKERKKQLKKKEKTLKADFVRIYTQLEQMLATGVVKGWSETTDMQTGGQVYGRFVAAQMARSLSGEKERIAKNAWNQVVKQPDVETAVSELEGKAASAVWGYAVPMSQAETIFEKRLVSSETRAGLEDVVAERILGVWQRHDRSFDTAKKKTNESLLGGGRGSKKLIANEEGSLRDASGDAGDVIKRQREDFVRLQRRRYPIPEEVVSEDQEPVRLREVDYHDSPEIKMWSDFWAKKVAGPIVENAILDWVQSLRAAGKTSVDTDATLADFVEVELKAFVAAYDKEAEGPTKIVKTK